MGWARRVRPAAYAATALARTLFRKGADFIAAIAFQFASTNLVVELSVLLAVMLGWQFTLAEFTGGPIMIGLIVVMLRMTLKPKLIEAARKQAERGLEGKMEGPRGDGYEPARGHRSGRS